MAFVKPTINVIKPDIKNLSIYLRSTKKFGKTTLFRDLILEKYGDPSRGLLVGCGNEKGYKLLDALNKTHVKTYKDLVELKDWLIKEKGVEHNIEIVAFDTGDELALIADKETIRRSNMENPNKVTKSIKGAFGGFTGGEKYSANDLIKPYMTELQDAGFGVWVIAHTKFKTIKEKGGLDEDGYMQLTSNMGADYEAAFGDIFDATLTGVIDRNLEEKQVKDTTKKYATTTVRRLYFRGTPLIDAGGRFADGAVPEYLEWTKSNMAAEFLKIVEEGMEKSKIDFSVKKSTKKKAPKVEEPVEEEIEEVVEDVVEETPFDLEEGIEGDIFGDELEEEAVAPVDKAALTAIRGAYKNAEPKAKAEVKDILGNYGGKLANEMRPSDVNKIIEILDI